MNQTARNHVSKIFSKYYVLFCELKTNSTKFGMNFELTQ